MQLKDQDSWIVGRSDVKYFRAGCLPPADALSKAKKAAETAIALDDTLGKAHVALGFARIFDWDWSGSEESFLRAIRVDPTTALDQSVYVILLSIMERFDEAEHYLKTAQTLDPTFPMNFVQAAWIYGNWRRYDDGIVECEKALELDPNFPPAHEMLGYLNLGKRKYDEAILHLEKNTSLMNRQINTLGFLGSAYGMAGQRAKATAILNEIQSTTSHGRGPVSAAMIQAVIGDIDAAFDSLELAFEQRDPLLIWVNMFFQFDSLRGDSRYSELVRRMGLKPTEIRESATTPNEKTRLAILPFTDNSPKPQEWLASGLADAISTRLGRVNPSKLGVLGPETTTFYAQPGKSIQDLTVLISRLSASPAPPARP